MTNIKKGDTVKVIAGRDKGMEGKVIQVHPADDRLIVEGVNRVKKHTKGDQSGNAGGIVTTEAPIHASNVMILEDGVPVRIGFRRDEVAKRRSDGTTYAAERSVRISRKTGKEI